ncbi:FHA domain-containing protein [Gallionella capsiferriformans]|jgi:pSer/pThr/pTyr-binding forkhead associated (FHA) protein|uniref:Forkhead-associated protein n=1 Tax=Gallionella capsiferriformans (strain ES-2) TaxID=395494 RepID=D9SCH3_GALCS|nr:FHA domain-containing protein [Gallionella capsiferriformans]ADL56554.1 Forkhead-associated protein [Gallionella capsiferriformans ES-2]
MTGKLILSLDGELIEEYSLNKERVRIGRKPDNDVVINNLAVSSHHAEVITIGHDSFMEDLDSTNGLSINGVAVKKHFLKNNDVIEIGKYVLKYLNDHVSQTSPEDFEKTMILRAPVAALNPQAEKPGDTGYFQKVASQSGAYEKLVKVDAHPEGLPVIEPAPVARAVLLAAIQILNGPNAGKELDLVKGLTTLGKPGVQVAVLTRRPQGFFITHVEGASFPVVNGEALGNQPRQLQDHDLIELAGVKMEFYFKN